MPYVMLSEAKYPARHPARFLAAFGMTVLSISCSEQCIEKDRQ